jgi:hypothetical protein
MKTTTVDIKTIPARHWTTDEQGNITSGKLMYPKKILSSG